MEIALKNGFEEMSQNDELNIEGGSTKIAAGVCTIGAGICFVVSGFALWSGHDKIAAATGIAGCVCGAAAGVLGVIPAP